MAIHVDVLARVKEQQVKAEARKLADEFDSAGHDAGRNWTSGFSDELIKSSPRIQKAVHGIQNAIDRVTEERYKLRQMIANDSSTEQIEMQEARVEKALRARADAYRSAGDAASAYYDRIDREEEASARRSLTNSRNRVKAMQDEARARAKSAADERNQQGFGHVIDDIQKIGTEGFRTLRGLGTVALPGVAVALYETAQTAVTASQSIALLPGVALAAAAGIGTLKLATSGFTDAISNIRDPEKFGEALKALSPNAQQAALALQSLLPEFDKIQQATQDSFFKGFDQQFQNLATEFAPQIEQMTTGIAGSFNQMFMGVTNALMSGTGAGQVDELMNNISAAFQAAAPAAQTFTTAFLQIANVGSQFLPGLAGQVAGLAEDFSSFISEAAADGSLEEFMSRGIAAAEELGGAIMDIGTFMYDAFGDASQTELEAWRNALTTTLNTLEIIFGTVGTALEVMNAQIPETGKSFIEWISPLQIIADLIDSFKWFLDPNASARSEATAGAYGKLNDARRAAGLAPVDPKTGQPTIASTRAPGGKIDSQYTPNGVGGPGAFGLPQGAREGGIGGSINRTSDADRKNGWGPMQGEFDRTKPKKPSESDRRDAMAEGLDPSLWKVDPFAGMPGAGPAIGPVDPQQVLEGQHNVISQAHDLEEARKDRLVLERDNTATQTEIDNAKWKELEAGWALQKAQADLADKQRGTARNLKNGTDELSAALDPDLGLSKGLSGLADNLVRFLGSLALAGPMAQMQATANASPIQGGYGLLGIMGANNIAQGKSPLFGQPMPPGYDATTDAGLANGLPGAANYASYGAGGSAGAALPGESARDFAHRVMMPFWQSQGITATDHAADIHNEHQNGALDIPVSSIAQGQQVLQKVLSDPNVYGAIFDNQTYGYGHGATPQDYSGGHTGDPSADHQNHVHALYKPGDPNNLAPGAGGPGAYGASAPFTTGSGTPVYVTNWPGGGGGFAASAFGAAGSGAGAAVNPGQGAEGWRSTVASTVAKYGGAAGIPTNQQQGWVDAIVKQIDIESKGDPGAFNGKDSNGRGGTQAVSGLLQYLPSSYAASGGKLTGLPMMDPVGQIAGALLAPHNPDGSPQSLGQGGGWGPDFSLPVNVSGGAGESPIFPQQGRSMLGAGAGYTPGGGLFDPGAVLGGASPAAPGFTPAIPGAGPAGAGAPGQIGPFGVPPEVAATQGGLGASATTPLGAPSGAGPSGWAPATTQYGGLAPSVGAGGAGGVGIMEGGMIDTAANLAASAFPGVGQAAATGMKLASRAIQYAGQLAGIGVSGLMETFLPTGGSELANNGWLPRIIGGLAGAKPALPNTAGGKNAGAQPPLQPNQVQQMGPGMGAPQPPNQVNVEYNNIGATEDRAGADLTHNLTQMHMGGGMR